MKGSCVLFLLNLKSKYVQLILAQIQRFCPAHAERDTVRVASLGTRIQRMKRIFADFQHDVDLTSFKSTIPIILTYFSANP